MHVLIFHEILKEIAISHECYYICTCLAEGIATLNLKYGASGR